TAESPRGTLRRIGYDSFVPEHNLAQSVLSLLARFEIVPTRTSRILLLYCNLVGVWFGLVWFAFALS
ncbi:hypothetical protein PspLS_07421, partial [Pyricularia sp. CBS 133598]